MTDPASRSLTFTGRIRSFSFAIRGVGTMLRSQQNAWIHAVATVAVVAAGLFFRVDRSDWSWLVLAILVVWMAEAVNTAIELLTDVASPDFHPLAGRAKDVAAGAVLIAAVGATVVGALVLGPHVVRWLDGGGITP